MIRSTMANVDVKLGIKSILSRIDSVYARRSQDIKTKKPLLVAVSKTKPIDLIIDAYSAGQRHFGENYTQELVQKAANEELRAKCPDIKWHFIGHLQKNKISHIINLPGLYMIETVDSEKLAEAFNSRWEKVSVENKQPLKVLMQVNTSQEEEKSGIEPNQVVELYRYITENCNNLKLEGLMTIGKFGHDYCVGPNPDFTCLIKCRDDVCTALNVERDKVELSMGMSDDFEQAIEAGSTIVRVGSSIFGYRPKKNETTHSAASEN